MAGKATNCAQVREQLFDAATDAPCGSNRAALDAHLADCPACAKEFHDARVLTQAIDQSLSARLAVEPSPQLISNVRREIAEQSHGVAWWWQPSAWLTAVGVCAALAVLIFAVRSVSQIDRATRDHATAAINAPSTWKGVAHPRPSKPIETAANGQPHQPALAAVPHVSRRTPHRKAAEPEVIVEPGQMQAILRLAAATQSGEIDGTKVLDNQEKLDEPLEIQPLVIVPLKIAALDDEAAPASGDKDFVAGHVK